MPPSTHYLNLLNLNGIEDQSQHTSFSNEDIAKELELFTNTSFSEFEPYYPQAHDQHVYDNQLLDPSSLQATLGMPEKPKLHNTTLPRNQRPQFQPVADAALPVASFAGPYDPAFAEYHGPTKRTAEQAGHDQTTPATPSSHSQADEEDKRRRNTAASARFRIKKKQREQALLESAKQMTDKNAALEARIKELEMENKFLKSMLKPVSPEQVKNVSNVF